MNSIDTTSIAQSARLIIRTFSENDIAGLSTILCDPEVMRFSMAGVRDAQGLKDFVDNANNNFNTLGYCQWAVVNQQNNELIGICGLNQGELGAQQIVHINYRLAHAHWGKGYALEAVNAVLDYAQENLPINSIYALIEQQNDRSVHLAEKAGLSYIRPDVFLGCEINVYHKKLK